ncbi:hypothetical protein EJ104_02810 [Deinococcus radiophilus]|uniref:Uncharacterized protein n=1 Tax=Deinococcus radiophilus TaxID=32062 RepID=A0A431W3B4_9DEIO|nr:hypothetical protein EJ104_02810 [Deinococcus radiophilus]
MCQSKLREQEKGTLTRSIFRPAHPFVLALLAKKIRCLFVKCFKRYHHPWRRKNTNIPAATAAMLLRAAA